MRQRALVALLVAGSACAFHTCSPASASVRHKNSVRRRVSEEVESFDVDFDIDRLDAMNTYITDVKQKGYVPASSNIVYDCTHGQWLLMQVAYDRKIKLFASRSAAGVADLAAIVPDDAQVLFTGAFLPKHAKRLLKLRNLHSVVVPDAAAARALSDAMADERARLAAKGLSKVSRARERYLTAGGGAQLAPPDTAVLERIRVFLKLPEEGSTTAAAVAATLAEVREGCPGVEVMGLWGEGRGAYALLQEVKAAVNAPKLKVTLPYRGVEESFKWNQGLGEGRGSIIWTFEFE
ncbi:hypothetical protein JKP88DRAFT_352055 [Tribonema minus]|uniref:Uncharacterized protein n=1 Tax=Tribonema minus TaxID=303371 RepID=A0A836CMK3_9STRA|nr:hypothetical protein JKP88DRAFT_352055 [Tribonema minus]